MKKKKSQWLAKEVSHATGKPERQAWAVRAVQKILLLAPFRLVIRRKIFDYFMIRWRARVDRWTTREGSHDLVIFDKKGAPTETTPRGEGKQQGFHGHPHHQQSRSSKKHRRFMDVVRLTQFYVLDHRRSVRSVRLGATGGRLVVKAHQD